MARKTFDQLKPGDKIYIRYHNRTPSKHIVTKTAVFRWFGEILVTFTPKLPKWELSQLFLSSGFFNEETYLGFTIATSEDLLNISRKEYNHQEKTSIW